MSSETQNGCQMVEQVGYANPYCLQHFQTATADGADHLPRLGYEHPGTGLPVSRPKSNGQLGFLDSRKGFQID
jgi:hypothetical protein